jgi:predicted RNase H-like HicB family nuclease
VIEQVEDGTYLATSPALEGFLVQADTLDDVIALAPGIARALMEAKRAHGIPLDLQPERLTFPLHIEVLVG